MDRSNNRKSSNPKAFLYFIIALFAIAFALQALSQLFGVENMHRVNGKVICEAVATTSQGYNRRSRFPIQSLLLTLDNHVTYYIPLDDSDWDIQNQFYTGKTVTVYQMPLLYKILSLSFLHTEDYIAQAELDGKILYRFETRKRSVKTFMWFCFAAVIIFFCPLYFWYKEQNTGEDIPTNEASNPLIDETPTPKP